ncbi:magnesium transporter CorA family protein [Micromonospora sp. NPDC049523]|uniref:magnesium transporter CorA family protein n=1 Tax=Micromonospora sp. NPDC049523 TaxID=3155921 RepID=UPI0034344402
MSVRSRLYRDGELIAEDFPATEVASRLNETERSFAWLDLCGPTAQQIALLTEEFGMHPLAVEDAVQQAQRAKLDRYDSHLFLNTYMAELHPDGSLNTAEVAAFINQRVLITVRYDERFDISQLLVRWDENIEMAKYGVSFLIYGLVDALVDGHFEAVQQLDQSLVELQNTMFRPHPESYAQLQERTFLARRNLVRLRQVALPMREVVNSMMRPTMHLVSAPMLPYFQDVYDHVLRVVEWTESLRDLNNAMLETNLMLQNNTMNQIVKQVTSWAAIIAVPTAITGFFGQNVAFPWEHTLTEFIVSTIVTIGIAVGLFVEFKRRQWI